MTNKKFKSTDQYIISKYSDTIKEQAITIGKLNKVIKNLAHSLQDSEPFPCEDCEHKPNKLQCDATMCAEQWIKQINEEVSK